MNINIHYRLGFFKSSYKPYGLSFLVLGALLLSSCAEEIETPVDYFPAIRIKVLNGCGFHGAAAEMASYLNRNSNVDIIGVGNADSFNYNRTIIVMKKDSPEELKRLKKYTNIERHAYALSSDANESFQVIVGMDYKNHIK